MSDVDKMGVDIWDAIQVDASAFEGLTTQGGGELSDLIRKASQLNRTLKRMEDDLKSTRKNRDRYLYEFIPAKMSEMGLDKIEVDGNKVSLRTFVSGTMPKDPIEKDNALAHLREIGAADFIKNDISVSFGVTQDNSAKALRADL